MVTHSSILVTKNWTRQKQLSTHANAVNRSLTKKQRQYNGAKVVFSANGAGTTGQRKLTPDDSQT